MRILIVVSEAPPITSGVSRCIAELTRELTRLDIDVDVLSSNEIRRWTFGEFRVSSMVGHWRSVSRSLDSYDVINVHGPAPTMSDVFLALFRATRSRRRPALVYTHHSSIELDGLRAMCRVYDSVTTRLAAVADRVVVTSDSYRDLIGRAGGPPVEVVPWGVDDSFTRVERRESPRPPLRVLFVGQMRAYKGIPVLLRAVAGARNLELTLVGGGPLEESYRRDATSLGVTNATFKGRVSDEELRRLYADHDVVVLPSTTRAEAYGLVLLEGMAAGCVPVASDLPGVRDLAGPTGVLVQPGSVTRLRESLLGLGANPGRLVRLSAASRNAARLRTWENTGSRYADIFADAIRHASARPWLPLLRAPFNPPEIGGHSLAQRFRADWWSLLLFERRRATAGGPAWGRAAAHPLHAEPPRIASYVAETGEPLLLDARRGPLHLRSILTREDVGSAMAVRVPLRRGARGVLSLSLGPGDDRRFTRGELRELVELVR